MTRRPDPPGFTLVEGIVALVLAGVLCVVFLNIFGTPLTSSGYAVHRVVDEHDVENALERVEADYVQTLNTNPSGVLATIKTAIDGGTYGANPVLTTQYVTFNAGVETASGSSTRTLKVTVSKGGFAMIAYFTASRLGTEAAMRF